MEEKGGKCIILTLLITISKIPMSEYYGTFDCKMDPKNRFILPAGVKRQVDPADKDRYVFMMTKGIEEDSLFLYPIPNWKVFLSKLKELNNFDPQNIETVRYFMDCSFEVEMDNQNRIAVNKKLVDHLNMDSSKELLVIGLLDYFEIWDASTYEKRKKEKQSNIKQLAHATLGSLSKKNNNNSNSENPKI